jgi:polyadenylation factor subunit 2
MDNDDRVALAWHPVYEQLFVSGGSEGSIYHWAAGELVPIASLEPAHESNVS